MRIQSENGLQKIERTNLSSHDANIEHTKCYAIHVDNGPTYYAVDDSCWNKNCKSTFFCKGVPTVLDETTITDEFDKAMGIAYFSEALDKYREQLEQNPNASFNVNLDAMRMESLFSSMHGGDANVRSAANYLLSLRDMAENFATSITTALHASDESWKAADQVRSFVSPFGKLIREASIQEAANRISQRSEAGRDEIENAIRSNPDKIAELRRSFFGPIEDEAHVLTEEQAHEKFVEAQAERDEKNRLKKQRMEEYKASVEERVNEE